MAIGGMRGQILVNAGNYVLDRIQTAGPGDLSIRYDRGLNSVRGEFAEAYDFPNPRTELSKLWRIGMAQEISETVYQGFQHDDLPTLLNLLKD